MGFDAQGLAMQAAGTVQDTLLGLALEGHTDRRQLKQQGKLLKQQAEIDRKQAVFNQALGLDTWRKTGPVALSEELEKAGLNKALQYGKSGGGGQTMGVNGASVNAESAPRGGGEIMGLQLMKAQENLIRAQTENVEADTENKGGFVREKGEAEARLAKNVAQFYVDTYDTNYKKLLQENAILDDIADKSRGTKNVEIEMKKAELVGLGIANELKKAETALTEEQMKATAASVAQKWQEVNIKQGHLDLDKFIKDVKESTKLTTETILKVISIIK